MENIKDRTYSGYIERLSMLDTLDAGTIAPYGLPDNDDDMVEHDGFTYYTTTTAAKKHGHRFYVSSKPCVNGHGPLRYVTSSQCVACSAGWSRKKNEREKAGAPKRSEVIKQRDAAMLVELESGVAKEKVMAKYKVSERTLRTAVLRDAEIKNGKPTRKTNEELRVERDTNIVTDAKNGIGIPQLAVKYKLSERRISTILQPHELAHYAACRKRDAEIVDAVRKGGTPKSVAAAFKVCLSYVYKAVRTARNGRGTANGDLHNVRSL